MPVAVRVVALDLERTLIDHALNAAPRPGLFEFLTARNVSITDEMRRACVAYSVPEMIRTGTTTVMEIGGRGEDVVELAGKAGLRAYVGQGFRSGRWYTDDGRTVFWSALAGPGVDATWWLMLEMPWGLKMAPMLWKVSLF